MNWPAPWALGAIEYPRVPPIEVTVVAPGKSLLDGKPGVPGVVSQLMEAAAKTGAEIADIKTAIKTVNSEKAQKYGWPESTIGSLYFIRKFTIMNATTEAILNLGKVSPKPMVKVELKELSEK